MAKLGPLSGGTFRAELVDVAIGGQFIVAVQHATASHRGKVLDITACQLMTVRDGLIYEVRGHYSDQEALDAFWR
jgi:ketosteroid isomerase-like protein